VSRKILFNIFCTMDNNYVMATYIHFTWCQNVPAILTFGRVYVSALTICVLPSCGRLMGLDGGGRVS
jgi:hypothetical protein